VSDYHVDAGDTGHNERLIAKALATHPCIPPKPIALTVTRPMVLVCIKSLASAGLASSPPAATTFAGPAMSIAMFLFKQLRPGARHAAWLMPVGDNSDPHG
jgi:hypothetical protein